MNKHYIYVLGYTMDEMSEKVNENARAGYKPVGKVHYVDGMYVQRMKYRKRIQKLQSRYMLGGLDVANSEKDQTYWTIQADNARSQTEQINRLIQKIRQRHKQQDNSDAFWSAISGIDPAHALAENHHFMGLDALVKQGLGPEYSAEEIGNRIVIVEDLEISSQTWVSDDLDEIIAGWPYCTNNKERVE